LLVVVVIVVVVVVVVVGDERRAMSGERRRQLQNKNTQGRVRTLGLPEGQTWCVVAGATL
jgi:hypothetical protein